MTTFLHAPTTPSLLTPAEHTYYTTLSLLSAALLIALSTPRSDPSPKTLSMVTKSIKTALTTLRTTALPHHPQPGPKPSSSSPAWTSYTGTETHALACLHATATAIKHSAAFVLTFHDRELARDRSGRSGLHRDVLAEMKALGEVAGKGVAKVKGWIQKLKEGLAEGGWLDRVLDLVFGDENDDQDGEDGVARAVEEVVGGRAGAEEWAGRVVESWREGVKGWGMVRME